MAQGSIPARCHIWVEFVGASRLALRIFIRVLQLPPPARTTRKFVKRVKFVFVWDTRWPQGQCVPLSTQVY